MLFSIPFDCSYYDTIIFMYSGLRNTKLLCGLTHGRVMLNDIVRNINCPLFDILFQTKTPQEYFVSIYEYPLGVMTCFLSETLLDDMQLHV